MSAPQLCLFASVVFFGLAAFGIAVFDGNAAFLGVAAYVLSKAVK